MPDVIRTGDRVYLRRIIEDDATALARASHLESETGFHEDGRFPMSELAMRSWIRGLDPSEQVFAICRTGDDACIGTASIRRIDHEHGNAETGSGLLFPEDRGQGLGTEAKRLLLDYAFTDLGLHALHSTVWERNARSVRALEKQGYKLAGRLTANAYGPGGVIGDTLVLDITRDDWEKANEAR